MPIDVAWDDPDKTTLLYTYQGAWTIEEFKAVINQAADLAAEVQHPVATISDFQNARVVPKGALNALQFGIAEYNRNPSAEIVVIVGANTFMRRLTEVGNRLYGQKESAYQFVDTLEAARKLIRQQRQRKQTQ